MKQTLIYDLKNALSVAEREADAARARVSDAYYAWHGAQRDRDAAEDTVRKLRDVIGALTGKPQNRPSDFAMTNQSTAREEVPIC